MATATVLSTWIDKKVKSLRKRNAFKKTDKSVPLPALPHVRPRVLTPSSSSTFLAKHALSAGNSAGASFFDRFPYEIRRQILIEAFGDQVLHMHLILGGYDGKKKRVRNATFNSHANLMSSWERKLASDSLTWNHNKWCWHGSICHRGAPASIRAGIWMLWECSCLNGGYGMCSEMWPSEIPYKCFIGIMGWLLSCRQAYVEGIDVLYTTNTIHLSSNLLILNLPQLLLPQRLASITSLEMRWELDPDKPDFFGFHGLAAITIATFPQIQKLFISLEGYSYVIAYQERYKEGRAEKLENQILKPIDAIVCKLQNMRTFRLDLSRSLYKVLRVSMGLVPDKSSESHVPDTPLWRSLGNSEWSAPKHLLGYWIRCGLVDHAPWEPRPCFGTPRWSEDFLV